MSDQDRELEQLKKRRLAEMEKNIALNQRPRVLLHYTLE